MLVLLENLFPCDVLFLMLYPADSKGILVNAKAAPMEPATIPVRYQSSEVDLVI